MDCREHLQETSIFHSISSRISGSGLPFQSTDSQSFMHCTVTALQQSHDTHRLHPTTASAQQGHFVQTIEQGSWASQGWIGCFDSSELIRRFDEKPCELWNRNIALLSKLRFGYPWKLINVIGIQHIPTYHTQQESQLTIGHYWIQYPYVIPIYWLGNTDFPIGLL